MDKKVLFALVGNNEQESVEVSIGKDFVATVDGNIDSFINREVGISMVI